MRIKSAIFAALCALSASAQFKSLQVLNPRNFLGQPIVKPGTEALRISFDELAEESRYLRYRLVHCDSDWHPSEISDMEYASGFNLGDIYDYRLSERTLTHYVHYDLMLPNDDVQPLLSGNYLVEIFDQDDPNEVLLTAPFMVSEGLASINLAVTSRTDVDTNSRHQQLSARVNLEGAGIDDPYNDLRLVIIQNGNPDTRRVLNHPLRTNSAEAVYEHQRELIFPAANEFRRFDMANVRYPGMRVENIDNYNAEIVVDFPRANLRYQYDEDQAGRYFPGELNATDPDINADYLWTHFTLRMPELNEPVYIDGDLTQRCRDMESQMIYDPSIGAYIKSLLLKQGMYNYQYVTPSGNRIEGDFYETGNEYLALLYYHPHGTRYDRLIGTATIHTNNDYVSNTKHTCKP